MSRPALSVCINTCAGADHAKDRKSGFGHGRPYGERAAKLESVLAYYRDAAPVVETIVVGEWHPGSGYRYIYAPGRRMDPIDPLAQRHRAASAAMAPGIIFMNDDHMMQLADLMAIAETSWTPGLHVLAFGRKRLDADGKEFVLEDGWPEYIMGHAIAMSHDALKAVPWLSVPEDPHWDVRHTEMLRKAGLNVAYTPGYTAWDIEQGEMP